MLIMKENCKNQTEQCQNEAEIIPIYGKGLIAAELGEKEDPRNGHFGNKLCAPLSSARGVDAQATTNWTMKSLAAESNCVDAKATTQKAKARREHLENIERKRAPLI